MREIIDALLVEVSVILSIDWATSASNITLERKRIQVIAINIVQDNNVE